MGQDDSSDDSISDKSVDTTMLFMDRLRSVLNDPLVVGPAKQRTLTDIGRHVLVLAREKLDAHERRQTTVNEAEIRLGVGSVFIDKFTRDLSTIDDRNLRLSSAICFEVADRFANGELDIAYVLDVKNNRQKLDGHIIEEIKIDLCWAAHLAFDLVQGMPVPMAVYPGDKPAIDALSRAKRDFRIMFSSPEYLAKMSAVRSGKYLTAMPRRFLEAPLVELTGNRLPPLPPATVLVAVRNNNRSERMRPILSALARIAA